MNARVFKIWLFLCSCHGVLALVLPMIKNNWVIGTFIIYLTVLLLTDIGVPGLVVAAETCGWETPTKLGWAAGVMTWLLFYFLGACLINRCFKPGKKI